MVVRVAYCSCSCSVAAVVVVVVVVAVVVVGKNKDWGPENKLSEPILEFACCSFGASMEFCFLKDSARSENQKGTSSTAAGIEPAWLR